MISCWRAYPWNPEAAENQPFSAAFVPAGQGYGRFDLSGEDAGVRYYAETPEHAIAERIVRLRNQTMEEADLIEFGFPLALVEVGIDKAVASRLVDLCDTADLNPLGIQPDRTAFRDRTVTQAISQRIHDAGYAGLRWWSAFFGEWHTIAVFARRAPNTSLQFGTPEPLHLDHPALRDAADALGITL